MKSTQNNWEIDYFKEFPFMEPSLGNAVISEVDKINIRFSIRSVEEKAREEESLKWGDRVRKLEGKIKNLRAQQELLSSVDKSFLQSLNK